MKKLLHKIAGVSVIVILTAAFGPSFSQDSGSFYTVNGIVKDTKTKEVVVFASISVPGTNIGTVTNSDGEFTLKVQKSLNVKEFEISHLGYLNRRFGINGNGKNQQVFHIDPHSVSLKEVIVRPVDPRTLVIQAIDRIDKNYTSEANMLTGFYRETIKQRRDYLSISEAIADIYKAPYSFTYETDRVKLHKGRKSSDVKRADTLVVKLQGGPQVALLLDIVKNPDVLFSKESVDLYNYEFLDIVSINNEMNYIIGFTPAATVEYPLYTGKLYLSVERLAVTMAEFSLDLTDKEKATQSFVRKKPAGLRFEPVNTSYLVTYKQQDGKYFLNYMRTELKFSCDWKKRLFKTHYTVMSEMAITERRADNIVKFPAKETFKQYTIMSDKVQEYFDEDYWGTYNTIEPDESIESAIKKFNKRVKKQ